MIDNIKEAAADASEICSYLYDEYQAILPKSSVDAATDWANVTGSLVHEFVKKNSGNLTAGMKLSLGFSIKGKFVAFDIFLDALGDDSWKKSFAKNIAGHVAGLVASHGTAAAVGGILGGPVGIVVGVAVGYFTSEFVTATVGEWWDYSIGPEIKVGYDKEKKSLTVITNGKLSDTFRNYWDGVVIGEDTEVKLFDQNEWILKSKYIDTEPLNIKYKKDINK